MLKYFRQLKLCRDSLDFESLNTINTNLIMETIEVMGREESR